MRVSWLISFLMSCACLATAQEPSLGPRLSSEGPQFVRFLGASTVRVSSSKSSPVELRFEVTQGNHINSNKVSSELLIPTRLKLSPATDINIGRVEYPPGKEYSFAFAPDEKLSVYTGPFVINALVTATRVAYPGNYAVHGELQYQACSNRACYPPKKLPIMFPVKVVRSSSYSGRRNPRQSPHIHR
jgi:hypothetical protein